MPDFRITVTETFGAPEGTTLLDDARGLLLPTGDVIKPWIVLELNEELAPKADLGPPLLKETAAAASRSAFDQLSTVAASVPAAPPQANPLEEMIREMLRPILKQWLDDHLPRLVDEHVRREITRITGRPV